MPELPEVEVTRRSFATRIEGATVTSVHLGKPLRWPLGLDGEELGGGPVGGGAASGQVPLAAFGDAGVIVVAVVVAEA